MALLRKEPYILLKKLRRKYEGDKAKNDALDRIVWWSFPCVYLDFKDDLITIRREYSKIKQYRKRVRQYVSGMVATFGDKLYLVTLTFSDDYIDSAEDTLRQYVIRWLNSNCLDYYACVDYGKVNGRMHYHALCALDLQLFADGKYLALADDEKKWRYGFSSFRPLSTSDCDVYRSLNYAFKASAYSFKCADREKIKPFHKRGVAHWQFLDSDDF